MEGNNVFISNRRMHGHSHKLKIKHSKTVERSNFFVLMVIDRWNSLPPDTVTAIGKKLIILLR